MFRYVWASVEAEQCVEEQEESLKGAEGKSWDNNGSIVLLT